MKSISEVLTENGLKIDFERPVKKEHSGNAHSPNYETSYYVPERAIVIYNVLSGASTPQHLMKCEIPVIHGEMTREDWFKFDDWWYEKRQ